jgi:hypothetical protein
MSWQSIIRVKQRGEKEYSNCNWDSTGANQGRNIGKIIEDFSDRERIFQRASCEKEFCLNFGYTCIKDEGTH